MSASMEPRCKVCGDTGETDGSGYLDCRSHGCDAAITRMELNRHMSMALHMAPADRDWAVFQYAQSQVSSQGTAEGVLRDGEPSAPTDISRQLRAQAKQPFGPEGFALLVKAAEEIERYYGGMMAWKQTAETKDRKLSDEICARVNERVAARISEQPAQESEQQEPVAWLVFAEDHNGMTPQHPAYAVKLQATRYASMFGQTPTEVRPLYAAPSIAAPTEVERDAARLDFIIDKGAFISWSLRDGTIRQCQLMNQDKDEDFHYLSGDDKYFNTEREAIDAAIATGEKP